MSSKISERIKKLSNIIRIQKYYNPGFTLVETLVALAVLGFFFAAISLILHQVLQNTGEARTRTVALSLAQEKMELIRNLPYNQVGTSGGIPQGPLLQVETVNINNLAFKVTTSVIYIDDPFDGTTPNDFINTDYKRARVEITWEGVYKSRYPVSLVTNIVPKGVESLVGGGTLFIQVFNSNSQPVENATITIDNTQIQPEIHTQTLTNTNGLIVLPGAPACNACYQISATKTGFSTDRTYSNTEVANPLQPYATILESQITQVSFAIDELSSLTFNTVGTRESGYPPVGNVQFSLIGSKIIGHNTQDEPVYKFQTAFNSGGGSFLITDLEWDTYTLDFSNSFFNLAGSNPVQPFGLLPKTNLTIAVSTAPKTNTSYLIVVRSSTGDLQASAAAKLSNTALQFDLTKNTAATGAADFGQVFFGGLAADTYDLIITLPGYIDATSSVVLFGIKQETFTLNLQQ